MPDNSRFYRSLDGYATVMAAYDTALAHWPVPHANRLICTRYGLTHVIVAGREDGPPVLLLHDWNGNASGIHHGFDILFRNYRVYAPDTIGQPGKSSPARLPTRGPAYGEWLADTMDSLALTRAAVIGVSGGGWLGLKLAVYAPTRVNHVVAISPTGLAPFRLHYFFYGLSASLLPSRSTVGRFLGAATSPDATKGPEFAECEAGLYSIFKHYKPEAAPPLLTDAELLGIAAPTLLLFGEHERMVNPRAAAERARRLIPNLVDAEIIPHAGHMLPLDQPDAVEARVLAFLGGTTQ